MFTKRLIWSSIFATWMIVAAPSVFGDHELGHDDGATVTDPSSPTSGFTFPGFSQLKVCLGATCAVAEGILQVVGVLPSSVLGCFGSACDCPDGDESEEPVTLSLVGDVLAELVGNNGAEIPGTESFWQFADTAGDTSEGLKIDAKVTFDDKGDMDATNDVCVYSAFAVPKDQATPNPAESIHGSLVRVVTYDEDNEVSVDRGGSSAEIKGCPIESNNPNKAVQNCVTALRIGIPVENEQNAEKIWPENLSLVPAYALLQVAAIEVADDKTLSGGDAADIDARQRPCVSDPLTTVFETPGAVSTTAAGVIPDRDDIDCGNPNSNKPNSSREVAGAARLPSLCHGVWQSNHVTKAGTNTAKYCVLDSDTCPAALIDVSEEDSLTLNGFPRAPGSTCNYPQVDAQGGADVCCFWVEGDVALECNEGESVQMIGQGTVVDGSVSYDFVATFPPGTLPPNCEVN